MRERRLLRATIRDLAELPMTPTQRMVVDVALRRRRADDWRAP